MKFGRDAEKHQKVVQRNPRRWPGMLLSLLFLTAFVGAGLVLVLPEGSLENTLQEATRNADPIVETTEPKPVVSEPSKTKKQAFEKDDAPNVILKNLEKLGPLEYQFDPVLRSRWTAKINKAFQKDLKENLRIATAAMEARLAKVNKNLAVLEAANPATEADRKTKEAALEHHRAQAQTVVTEFETQSTTIRDTVSKERERLLNIIRGIE